MNKPGFRIVQIVRSIGPTSSAWNDLYPTGRRLAPGLLYPPVMVRLGLNKPRWRKAWCIGQNRYYVDTGFLPAFLYLRKLIRRVTARGEVLIVHMNGPIFGLLAMLLKIAQPNVRIVTTQHTDWRFVRFHQRMGFWLLAKLSDRYVACGRAVAQTIPTRVRQALEENGKISCTPNGIDSKQMVRFDCIRGENEANNRTRVTAVVAARMVPAKNCHFVPRLMKECRSITELIWFGDGPQRSDLEDQIRELGLEARIQLRGQRPREEVLAALAQSTFYINASKWEGLSVADLEAAALGCWPMMSDIIQRQEIAETLGVRLYPLADSTPWIEGIDAFLKLSPDERRKLRDTLARKTRENFSVEKTFASYFETYTLVAQ
jgi:glycosyltransferase involved in cell wall biosynthesis